MIQRVGLLRTAGVAAVAAVCAAVLRTTIVAAAPPTDLLVNGDFESQAISQPWTLVPSGTSALPGWTVIGNAVEVMRSYWQPAHGSQSVNLSSSGSSAEVAQTVATTTGTRYTVSWFLSGNPQCTSPPVRRVDVLWGGAVVADPSFDVSGHSFSAMGWTSQTISVVASGSTSTLAFQRDAGDGSCGIAIDDVTLTATAVSAPPPVTGTHGASASPTPGAAGAVSSSSTASGHVVPSTIAASLPSPADAFSSGSRLLLSALVAVLAILLITFPAQLFNSTFEENYADIVAFWERHVPLVRRLRAASSHAGSHENVVLAWIVILLGALLGGLLDPHFGFNMSSLTTYVAVVLATLWGIGVSTTVLSLYRRMRALDRHWSLRALPAGLAIAVACVLISRLSDFQPGYLYGVVCGAAFVTALGRTEQGHAVAVTTLVTVTIALIAWLIWTPVNGAASAAGAVWPVVVLDDFLGSVFVGGLIGSTIGMIPLRFLPGGTLAGWHRGVWSAVTGVVTFAFVAILLLPGRGGHPGHAALATVLALFLLFGTGSVLFALYFQRKRRRVATAPAKTG